MKYEFLLIFMLAGLISFCSTHKHLLLALLSLEYISLAIFSLILLISLSFGYEMFLSLGFLVFSVCEGALGLSILVSLVRTQGNDYLSSMSVLSW